MIIQKSTIRKYDLGALALLTAMAAGSIGLFYLATRALTLGGY
jgi:hypothetical protein